MKLPLICDRVVACASPAIRCDVRLSKGARRRAILPCDRGASAACSCSEEAVAAQLLNEQVPLALYKSGTAVADWQIVHQTGQRDRSATAELYRKLGLEAIVVPFIENMPEVLRRAIWPSAARAAPRWPSSP